MCRIIAYIPSEIIYYSIFNLLHQLPSPLNLCITHLLLLHYWNMRLVNTIFLQDNSLSGSSFRLILKHLLASLFLFFATNALSLLHQSAFTILLGLHFTLFLLCFRRVNLRFSLLYNCWLTLSLRRLYFLRRLFYFPGLAEGRERF